MVYQITPVELCQWLAYLPVIPLFEFMFAFSWIGIGRFPFDVIAMYLCSKGISLAWCFYLTLIYLIETAGHILNNAETARVSARGWDSYHRPGTQSGMLACRQAGPSYMSCPYIMDVLESGVLYSILWFIQEVFETMNKYPRNGKSIQEWCELLSGLNWIVLVGGPVSREKYTGLGIGWKLKVTAF